jgi:phosphotriesterase-related protein
MSINNDRRGFVKSALAASMAGIMGKALDDLTVPASAQVGNKMQSGLQSSARIEPKDLIGKAQTVLGPVDGESLGITSCHEHLLWDLSSIFNEPESARERELAHQPVQMSNLYWVRANPHSNVDNLLQTEEELAISESLPFKNAGGRTIVELTQTGMSRNPVGLARIARATGLNIIMGSGYYIGKSHPPDLDSKTEEDIAREIVNDITTGVGDTGIHSGIIGEIGCSVPLTKNERKVLRASAMAQRQTGAPMNVHPSMSDDLVMENIKILKDAGADLSRVAISHIDGFEYSPVTRMKILEEGCYVSYDGFGQLVYHFLVMDRVLNGHSDIQRINDIIEMIDAGYINQIQIAQDFCFKSCLAAYGGYGYAHILNNLLPFMRAKGITDRNIHTLLVENAKRFLEFVPAQG